MFAWMAWTLPVAVFFTCIVLMLVGMTVWEIKSPTVLRKGFLPIETTRGDRLFIGLLSAAYVNLAFVALSEKMIAWFGLESEPSIWISFVISMLLLGFIIFERQPADLPNRRALSYQREAPEETQ
jgi:predicted small integral membrane protein